MSDKKARRSGRDAPRSDAHDGASGRAARSRPQSGIETTEGRSEIVSVRPRHGDAVVDQSGRTWCAHS